MALHRSYTGVLKEEPIVHLVPFSRAFGIANLIIGVVAFNEVLHDASRLEQVDSLTISELVCQRRNATIWVDCQEPVFLLRILADVNFLNFIGQTVVVNR